MWHNSDVTVNINSACHHFIYTFISHYYEKKVNCDILSHYEKLKLTVNIEMIMKDCENTKSKNFDSHTTVKLKLKVKMTC